MENHAVRRWLSIAGRALFVTVVVAVAGVMVVALHGGGTAQSEPAAQQRGFTLIWDGTYNGPQIVDSLREMRAVGATSVQFTPAWFQQTANASVIAPTVQTVSDDNLAQAISQAQGFGLSVHLSPHTTI